MSSMVTKRRWMAGLVIGIVGLTGIGTGVVTATGFLVAPPKGATIAVVDLEKLINGLDEKKAKAEQFQKAFEAKKAELETMKVKIDEKQAALNAMPAGANRSKAAEELQEMVIRGEIEAQLANRKLNAQQADLFHQLYTKVDEAIGKLAEQNGYHMVFVSDEAAKVPKGNSETVLRGITMKRMLYVNDELDITNEVIKYMNNAFAAAGLAPASPAGTTATAARTGGVQ